MNVVTAKPPQTTATSAIAASCCAFSSTWQGLDQLLVLSSCEQWQPSLPGGRYVRRCDARASERGRLRAPAAAWRGIGEALSGADSGGVGRAKGLVNTSAALLRRRRRSALGRNEVGLTNIGRRGCLKVGDLASRLDYRSLRS